MKKKISILNDEGKLVGRREAAEKEKLAANEVALDSAELPLDGSYKFNPEKKELVKVRKVSVLNKSGQLIGKREAEEGETLVAAEAEIDSGDLPLDGSYKFDEVKKTFVPLGHGMTRVSSKPPLSESLALYHVIKALGDDVNRGAIEWANWYEKNLKQRDEETIQFKKIRGNKP